MIPITPMDSLSAHTTLNRLGALQSLGEVINAHLDLKTLLNSVIDMIFSELKAHNGSILLIDEEKPEQLYIASSRGLSREVTEKSVPMGQGIAGRVLQNGKPLLIHGPSCQSNQSLEGPSKGFQPTSSLCVPLTIKGNIKGVICVNLESETRTFSYKDLQMLQIMASQTATAIDNVTLMDGLRSNNYAIVRSLAEAVETKDPYTAGHCDFVAKYSAHIAKAMNLLPREIEEIKIGAILHDVGKIGINEDILSKTSRLTDSEFEIMKQHPLHSIRIVTPLHLPNNCLHVIKYHHERVDGKGYPFGLVDDEIYLGAKIVSVADTFDAITSNRPYRNGLTVSKAIQELKTHAGSQFDPKVVQAFLDVMPEMYTEKILRPHLRRELQFEHRRPRNQIIHQIIKPEITPQDPNRTIKLA